MNQPQHSQKRRERQARPALTRHVDNGKESRRERKTSRLFTVKSSLDASLEVQILTNGGSRGGPDGRGRQRASGGRGRVGQAHEETANSKIRTGRGWRGRWNDAANTDKRR